MRIAASRRANWLMSDHSFEGRTRQVRLGEARLEVVEIGKGDPIVVVPGLAGGWKLLAPLARKLAKRKNSWIAARDPELIIPKDRPKPASKRSTAGNPAGSAAPRSCNGTKRRAL